MSYYKIILASKSVDRKELLKRAKISYTAVASEVNEEIYKKEIKDPYQLVQKLAKEKALRVQKKINNNFEKAIVIAADTIVAFKHEIIGKAQDEKEAFKILRKLMGHSHELITGLAITKVGTDEIKVDYDKTLVKFLNLSDNEIRNYIKTQEWKGRAGAYSIREKASLFIESINGSYSNVLGLPIQKTYQILKNTFSINLFEYNNNNEIEK